MKNLVIILTTILFSNMTLAQEPNYNNYSKLWKQVEQFEKDGLPKSALKIVEDITKKAKKDDNSPQIVKS